MDLLLFLVPLLAITSLVASHWPERDPEVECLAALERLYERRAGGR